MSRAGSSGKEEGAFVHNTTQKEARQSGNQGKTKTCNCGVPPGSTESHSYITVTQLQLNNGMNYMMNHLEKIRTFFRKIRSGRVIY